MPKISIFIGAMLCLTGIVGYGASDVKSITAFIPLFFGLPIMLFAWLTLRQPSKAKIYMHVAVTLAILGFVASAMRVAKLEEFGSVKSSALWSMCILCFVLVGAYVQSFIKARTNKES